MNRFYQLRNAAGLVLLRSPCAEGRAPSAVSYSGREQGCISEEPGGQINGAKGRCGEFC